MMKEFKEFAVKGNMVDMAVGIIIGGAFGKIVSSLVSDVVMPPIGVLTGGAKSFADKVIPLGDAKDADGNPVGIKIGAFFDNVINFLIVAFAIFLMVKAINSMKRKEEEKPAEPEAPPEPPAEEKLLTEIRDLLKDGRG